MAGAGTSVVIREIYARSILVKSQVADYTVNPYVGCQHRCTYCYARFMKRFSGHKELWGEFVDVKINAPDLLRKEIHRKPPGTVWISGVCDPYQPIERKYELTRKCLQILVDGGWPITVQTKSPLVLRDIDLFRRSANIEVGLSIATADDDIRKLFEPNVPSIQARIQALGELHHAGIRTYAMICCRTQQKSGLRTGRQNELSLWRLGLQKVPSRRCRASQLLLPKRQRARRRFCGAGRRVPSAVLAHSVNGFAS